MDDHTDSDVAQNQALCQMSLSDLEEEIEIFRRESSRLRQQRGEIQKEIQKLQEQRLSIQRSFKEKELCLEVEHESIRDFHRKEEKQLAKKELTLKKQNKTILKDDLRSKKDHEQLLKLKDQLEILKSDLYQRDIRWSVIIARQRSQVRVLHTQNSKLKQELERLLSENMNKIKKVTESNTRVFHLINKPSNQPEKIDKVIENNCAANEKKKGSDCARANQQSNVNICSDKMILDKKMSSTQSNIKDLVNEELNERVIVVQNKPVKTIESIARKRDLYDNLLRDAIGDLVEFQFHEIEQGIYNYSSSQEDLVSNHESLPIAETKANENEMNEGVKFGTNSEGVWEVHHPNGCSEYWYPNGNVKKVFPDKCHTKMIYYNGDICETDKHGTVRYFYAGTQTWHTTALDGSEVLEFSDGQVEKRFKNGSVKNIFPDGSVKIAKGDGSEKWAFQDGTVAIVSVSGEKILTLPHGQREIHTKDYKRREYPDGTVKTVYSDGTQETRYSNGRIRKKDKHGNLLVDTEQMPS